MSQCRKRCRTRLGRVGRYVYRLLTGTLTQGRGLWDQGGGGSFGYWLLTAEVATLSWVGKMEPGRTGAAVTADKVIVHPLPGCAHFGPLRFVFLLLLPPPLLHSRWAFHAQLGNFVFSLE